MFDKRGFIFWEEMCPIVIVKMDASPVQSGSKCGGSDFSIDRILSDRKDSREQGVEAPDWLCCTRYRPPRLPRAASASAGKCRARRSGRHARVPFTAAQAAALEAAYARAPYLAPPALKALAAALQLRDDRIKIWFQNRRARERREKNTTIAPPQGVTIPPTTLTGGFPSPIWISRQNFSMTENSQAFINAKKYDNHVFPASIKSDDMRHDYLNVKRFQVPLNYTKAKDDHSSATSYDSREDDVEEHRPCTPLDIETIEE